MVVITQLKKIRQEYSLQLLQDSDNDIYSSSETANGTVCKSKEEAVQQVEN